MKKYLLILCSLSTLAYGQNNDSTFNVNEYLKLTLHKVEKVVNDHRRRIDSSCFVYFSFQNISADTITLVTNSCPSYNRYTLTFDDTTYFINDNFQCSFNAHSYHKIPPGGYFSDSEYFFVIIEKFPIESQLITFVIPVVMDAHLKFRIDGRSFINNSHNLVYQGNVPFIRTVNGQVKRTRKRRHK